jgi:hypothetical protein
MLKATSDFDKAANKAVMVVPIFAPIIKQKALTIVKRFAAAKGTTNDVVAELERIATVINVPEIKALKGVPKIILSNFDSVGEKTVCDNFVKARIEIKSRITASPKGKIHE